MTRVGEQFYKQHERYLNSVKVNKELYRNINKVLERRLKGTVVDIGNGGVFTYDTNLADDIIAVDVSFRDLSILPKMINVEYVCDDATRLKKLKSESCDVVIFQFVLHHLSEKDYKETMKRINLAIREARRILRTGGEILIIEIVVNHFIEMVERIFARPNFFILGLMDKPSFFFLSGKSWINLLKSNKFRKIKSNIVSLGKKIDVAGGIMPGYLIIPSYLVPYRCEMFISRK